MYDYAHRIAYKHARPPHWTRQDREDLTHDAMVAIIHAAKSWDPHGADWETWARFKAAGAVIDEVRHRIGRKINERRERDRRNTEQGRKPERRKRERRIGTRMPAKTPRPTLVELSDTTVPGVPPTDPEPWLHDHLTSALMDLTSQEVRVLNLRLRHERTFRDIGAVFGVSESRAHQVFTRALRTLRDHPTLREYR